MLRFLIYYFIIGICPKSWAYEIFDGSFLEECMLNYFYEPFGNNPVRAYTSYSCLEEIGNIIEINSGYGFYFMKGDDCLISDEFRTKRLARLALLEFYENTQLEKIEKENKEKGLGSNTKYTLYK
jgi:hypothetical protein